MRLPARERQRQIRAFRLDDVQTGEAGHVVFHSSVFGVSDTYGTIFDRGCFAKTIQENAGKFAVTWFHDPREAIGLGLHSEDATGLRVECDLDLDIEVGRRVYSGLQKGYIDCASISFDVMTEALENQQTHFKEARLYESALLTRLFGSNPGALVDEVRARTGVAYPAPPTRLVEAREVQRMLEEIGAGASALEGDDLVRATATVRSMLEAMESRGSTPFADLAMHPDRDRPYREDQVLPRVRKWASSDGSGDKEKMDWRKFRRAFFWYDPDNIENFEGYKLKFADVVDGELVAVWRGVALAAAVMQGARGGVDIPEADRPAVRKHIERYYGKARQEFDDDSIVAPWLERSTESPPTVVLPVALFDDARKLAAALAPRGPARPPLGVGRNPSIAPASVHALLKEIQALGRRMT